MQFNEINLNIDITTGSLVRDFQSSVGAFIPPFRRGDTKRVNIRTLVPTRLPDAPWREISLLGKTVRVGLGVPGEDFESGTFTVAYGASVSSAIAYNATASVVEAAINAMASIISAGLVDVIGPAGGPWTVTFRTVGDRTSFLINGLELFPIGTGLASVVTEGDGSTAEVVQLEIEISLLAFAELDGPLASAAISISTVIAGSASNNTIQLIDLSDPEPYGGVYSLSLGGSTTGAIPFDAAPDDIRIALEGIATVETGNVSVTGAFPFYEVEFIGTLANSVVALMAADSDALRVPTGQSGLLDLGTYQLAAYLKGNRTGGAYLEVEVSESPTIATLFKFRLKSLMIC